MDNYRAVWREWTREKDFRGGAVERMRWVMIKYSLKDIITHQRAFAAPPRSGGRGARAIPPLSIVVYGATHVPLPQFQQPAKVRFDRLSWRIELPEGTVETTDIFEIMH